MSFGFDSKFKIQNSKLTKHEQMIKFHKGTWFK